MKDVKQHIINNLKSVKRVLKRSDKTEVKEEHVWFNEIIWIDDAITYLELNKDFEHQGGTQ